MTNNNIAINILYKLQNTNEWCELKIDPENYFDKKYLDEGEIIEINSIPLFNHAIEYLEETYREKVSNTRLSITNNNFYEKIDINETYWNNHQNSIVERIDTNPKGVIIYNVIILTSLVNDSSTENTWEIIRFIKENAVFTPILHTFITENKNGVVSDTLPPPREISLE